MSKLDWLGLIGCFAALGVGIFILLRLKAKRAAKKHPLVFNVDIPFDRLLEQQFTPLGITVRSTSVVPPEALDAIDRGFQHTITNSRHYNPSWTNGGTPQEAQIFLIPRMTTNVETEPGSPALILKYLNVNGVDIEEAQTAGTNIGVDGSILYGVTDIRYPSVVVCEQSDCNWQYLNYLEESVRNEFEHNQEWLNSKSMFFTFATVGDVHPHFPDWSDSLVAETKTACNCVRPIEASTVTVDPKLIPGSDLRPTK
jgi:hypothetical protein